MGYPGTRIDTDKQTIDYIGPSISLRGTYRGNTVIRNNRLPAKDGTLVPSYAVAFLKGSATGRHKYPTKITRY